MSKFYGFYDFQLEVTNNADEAHILNFIMDRIEANIDGNLCKYGDKHYIHIAYSVIAGRIRWLSMDAVKRAMERMKRKGVIETIYNDYKRDHYRCYTVNDSLYKRCLVGVKESAKEGGARAIPPDPRAIPPDPSGDSASNNNTLNNCSNKKTEEEAASGPLPLITQDPIGIPEQPRISLEELSTKNRHATFKQQFNEVLAEGSRVPEIKVINDTRDKKINAISKEYGLGVEEWVQLFYTIKKSDFLMGLENGFVLTVDWLLKPENMLKVIEGNYTNGGNIKENLRDKREQQWHRKLKQVEKDIEKRRIENEQCPDTTTS